jgi:arsenite/tail-anchored protein-transporting ATPase
VPELAFFIGKGGVGKTTVSAAYAILRASEDLTRRVLVVSTDPAHSLGDVLQRKLDQVPTWIPIDTSSKLKAWEINSPKLFRSFLARHRQELIAGIERSTLFTAAEISSLLETTLPGMSEIAALLAIQDAIESNRYSDIVVDTAPFGHTLRLFALPEQFLRLLNFLELSADRDRVLAEHFGGRIRRPEPTFTDEWRDKVERLRSAFASARLFLVTTSERFALNESVRSIEALKKSNPELRLHAMVLNRVILRAAKCSICHKRAEADRTARVELRKQFRGARLYVAGDPGGPILGAMELQRFGAHVFLSKPLQLRRSPETAKRKVQFRLTSAPWPKLTTPLSFVLGKGGVGKTTVSAGLGFYCRAHSHDTVEICSVDPAPSLDDIFQTPVGDRPGSVLGDAKFRASELDSRALFRCWVDEVRAEVNSVTTAQYSGVHLDLSYERRLFSELLEIVPPGLDEVLAVFRIFELLGGRSRKVIIDMAPTGHALELLRTPKRILVWARLLLKSLAAHRKLALAREAAVKLAELEVRARELSSALTNLRRVRFFAVMLPEPLPDRETERLLAELDGLGVSADTIFVNRIFFPERELKCRHCSRAAAWQTATLAELRRRFRGKKIYAIRNFAHELVARRGLRELTSELWQLN